MQEQLLALVADYLAAANWQRGNGKRSEYPKPIPRPGNKPERFGKEPISMEAMTAWLGWDSITAAPRTDTTDDPEPTT